MGLVTARIPASPTHSLLSTAFFNQHNFVGQEETHVGAHGLHASRYVSLCCCRFMILLMSRNKESGA